MSDLCATCGHDRAFHGVGLGDGVPLGQGYCDDRHGERCACGGFVSMRPPGPVIPGTAGEPPIGDVIGSWFGTLAGKLDQEAETLEDRARLWRETIRHAGGTDPDVPTIRTLRAIARALRATVEDRSR